MYVNLVSLVFIFLLAQKMRCILNLLHIDDLEGHHHYY